MNNEKRYEKILKVVSSKTWVLFQHDNLQKYTLAFWSTHSPDLNPILRGEDQEPCQKMVKSGEV